VKLQHYHAAINHNMPVEIECYKDALDWWKSRDGQEYRGTNDRPAGDRGHSNRRMRMVPGTKSIAFEYDGHTLCTWHPDNTVSVWPYSTNKYGFFDDCVMPKSIEVDIANRIGSVIYLKPDTERATRRLNLADGRRVTNPNVLVVRADKPVTLSFDKERERWLPADEYALKDFQWFELNRSELRAASLKYNITEFEQAISTALELGAEIETAPQTKRTYVDSNTLNGESILELLEQSRYIEAAQMVRANVNRTYDSVNRTYRTETRGLKKMDLKKIRNLAYQEMGVTYLEQRAIVSLPELLNIQTKLRDFGVPVTDRIL
jgi:hypothetical protein